jgi:hypothetical protein
MRIRRRRMGAIQRYEIAGLGVRVILEWRVTSGEWRETEPEVISKMGRIAPHPRCFRKSGKQRTYRIRNLEEDTEDRKTMLAQRRGGAERIALRCTQGKEEGGLFLTIG